MLEIFRRFKQRGNDISCRDAGNDVGTYMVGGEIIIVGDIGENVSNWFIRGSISVEGKWQSIGHNCKEISVENEDVRKLEGYLSII